MESISIDNLHREISRLFDLKQIQIGNARPINPEQHDTKLKIKSYWIAEVKHFNDVMNLIVMAVMVETNFWRKAIVIIPYQKGTGVEIVDLPIVDLSIELDAVAKSLSSMNLFPQAKFGIMLDGEIKQSSIEFATFFNSGRINTTNPTDYTPDLINLHEAIVTTINYIVKKAIDKPINQLIKEIIADRTRK